MRNKRRRNRQISIITYVGALLLLISLVAPWLHSLHTFVQTEVWRALRLVGWVLVAIGVIRTGVLRRHARKVVVAKREAGLLGERQVARELKKLGSAYRVFHRIYLYHGERRQEFDHIIVGPTGVFHVESKNWAGQIQVSDHGVQRSVRGGDHDAGEQMKRHHALLTDLLHSHGIGTRIHGVLCFTNSKAQVHGHSSAYLNVRIGGLVEMIAGSRASKRLSSRVIQQVARVIEQNSEAHNA